MRTGARRLAGQRAELVQAEVHLVGDVAEVAAAAGGAAVVHLEPRDDALARRPGSPWCPGRRCRAPCACREHRVRAEAVAEDLGADLLLRERQARAAVAGADAARSARARAPPTRARPPRPSAGGAVRASPQRRAAHASSKAPAAVGAFSTSRIALSKSPTSRSKPTPSRARLLLGELQVAAAGEVAEEVALAARALGVERRPPPPSIRVEDLVRRAGARPRRRSASAERSLQRLGASTRELRAVLLARGSGARASRPARRAPLGVDAGAARARRASSAKRALISASLERHLAGEVVVAAASS